MFAYLDPVQRSRVSYQTEDILVFIKKYFRLLTNLALVLHLREAYPNQRKIQLTLGFTKISIDFLGPHFLRKTIFDSKLNLNT